MKFAALVAVMAFSMTQAVQADTQMIGGRVTIEAGAHNVSINNVDFQKLPNIVIHKDGSIDIDGAGTRAAATAPQK